MANGYHTFAELYAHRRALTAALASALIESSGRTAAWRTRQHHPEDAEPMFPGHFLVGIPLMGGEIRYHYADQYWDDFREVPEIPHAPKWDGAGPDETVNRLLEYARG